MSDLSEGVRVKLLIMTLDAPMTPAQLSRLDSELLGLKLDKHSAWQRQHEELGNDEAAAFHADLVRDIGYEFHARITPQ